MDFTEHTLTSETLFEGRIVKLRRDTVRVPGGNTAVREVVEHPGGVAILPLDQDGSVIMVRQYRYPLEQMLLEIPAGKLEYGEDPLACAIRELEEEIGVTAGSLVYLGATYPSPGYCKEVLHLYLARELTFGACHPDEDEFLLPERIPLDKLVDMVLKDEIRDGKTVAAILKTALLLKGV